jgi:mevalonate kinase
VARQFAPGKMMLTGEYSVTYGYPAITASLAIGVTISQEKQKITTSVSPDNFFIRQDGNVMPRDVYFQAVVDVFQEETNKKIHDTYWCQILSQIPEGYDLGRQTALVVAVLLNLAEELRVEISYEMLARMTLLVKQRVNPGTDPIDAYTISRRGIWQFYRSQGWQSQALFGSAVQMSSMILINTGIAVESAAEMTAAVGSFLAGNQRAKQVLAELGALSKDYVQHLEQGLVLDALIQQNHRLLCELPVVGNVARHVIAQIEAVGGSGKITGRGGVRAGSGMVLGYHQDLSILINLCVQNNWQYLPVA